MGAHKSKALKQDRQPEKIVWNPISLQTLSEKRFLAIVDRILSGRYTILSGTLGPDVHASDRIAQTFVPRRGERS